MKKRNMALLDWDLTLYDGFTLRSWVTFLSAHDRFPGSDFRRLEKVFTSYDRGSISYADLTVRAPVIYAQGMKGQDTCEIGNLACQYVRSGSHLYPHAVPVLSALHQHGVGVIVISGAPQEILEVYAADLGMDMVIGITLRRARGFYSGVIDRNSAQVDTKRECVKDLQGAYNISIAIGDSSADLPLLMAARKRLLVLHPERREVFSPPEGTIAASPDNILAAVVRELEKV